MKLRFFDKTLGIYTMIAVFCWCIGTALMFLLYNCLHVLVVRCTAYSTPSLTDLKLSLPLARDVLRYLLQPIELYQKTLGASSVRMSMLRSSYTSTKTPPACSAVMELCVSALELYCNAGRG